MNNPSTNPKEGLFSPTDDFIRLTEVARSYPSIQEIDVENKERFKLMIEHSRTDSDIVPVFLKMQDGDLQILKSNIDELEVESFEGTKLVYLGKPFDPEDINAKVEKKDE